MREITVTSDFTLPARSEKQIASNVLKGSLGNLIEWFDWYVYASFAIYFSGAFFPAHNPTAQLLAAADRLFHAAAWFVNHNHPSNGWFAHRL